MSIDSSGLQATQSSVYHSVQNHLWYLLKIPGPHSGPSESESLDELKLCIECYENKQTNPINVYRLRVESLFNLLSAARI